MINVRIDRSTGYFVVLATCDMQGCRARNEASDPSIDRCHEIIAEDGWHREVVVDPQGRALDLCETHWLNFTEHGIDHPVRANE